MATKPSLIFGNVTDRDSRHLAEILRDETVGGALMLAATVVALVWANVNDHSYQHLLHIHAGPLTVHGWVADGLLTVFFLVAGWELKRELTEGSLSRPADALVPIMAAIGGMVVPAGIYLAINAATGSDLSGWAIPMATDIAFALAVLAIVGSNLPTALRAFLLTLAIVDDLGAIIVIAVFFTNHISWLYLAGALGALAAFGLLQRRRFDSPWFAVVLGVIAWWCMFKAGVHPTIAGVLLGLLTRGDPDTDDDPLNRWQHAVEPWTAGLVVPIFALVSAGVVISPTILAKAFTNPITLGIMLGLFVGKTVGITGAAWATARFTRAELAPGIRRLDLLAVAQLAGLGFTVSLLMSDLAFPDNEPLAEKAKTAVLVASFASAIVGGWALRRRSNRRAPE